LPYTAAVSATGGNDGVVVVPSNSITTAPAYAATTPNQGPSGIVNYVPTFMAEADNFTVSGSSVTGYAPALLMFLAPDTSGNLHVYGTSLSPATGTPTSVQISSLSSPLNAIGGTQGASNICDYGQGQTNIYSPTTLFVVIHIAGTTGCAGSGSGDSWVVVHYTDSPTTAPVSIGSMSTASTPVAAGITTTTFTSLYNPSGALGGLALVNPTNLGLYFYTDDTFTTTIPSGAALVPAAGSLTNMLDQTITKQGTFSTSAYVTLQAQGAPAQLWQLTYTGTAAKCYTAVSELSDAVSDSTNFYFTDSSGLSTSGATVLKEPIGSCTAPTALFTSSGMSYNLVGSNGTLLVMSSSTGSFTSETSALATIPVGATSTAATPLASFTGSIDAFMASPTFGTPSGDEVFVSVSNYTSVTPSLTVAYSTEVLSPASTTPLQVLTANSTFQGLINPFGGDVFEISGITDTGGTYGGGTLYDVAIAGLAATPFKTQAASPFTIPAGYSGIFVGLSNTIGEGFITNAETASGTPTTVAYAFDQSQKLIVPVSVAGTTLSPL
jgi:hypothetical protein